MPTCRRCGDPCDDEDGGVCNRCYRCVDGCGTPAVWLEDSESAYPDRCIRCGEDKERADARAKADADYENHCNAIRQERKEERRE